MYTVSNGLVGIASLLILGTSGWTSKPIVSIIADSSRFSFKQLAFLGFSVINKPVTSLDEPTSILAYYPAFSSFGFQDGSTTVFDTRMDAAS